MDDERKSYWEKRLIQLYDAQDKKNAKFDKKMRREYHRLETSIQNEIAGYYSKYGMDGVIEYRKLVLSLSAGERDLLYKDYEEFARRNPQYMNLMPVRESIYKLNRLEGLQLNLRMQMVELGAFEQEGMDKLLKQAYENGYLSSMKGLDNAPSFFSLNSVATEKTLSEKWINEGNYSDRIWTNKSKLINTLNNEVRDGIIRGDDFKQISKMIQKRMSVGAYDSLRLVVTESAFVTNQANKQAFVDAGVKRYEVSAVMDRRTSPTCKSLDGEQFDFEDAKAGVNYPPFHAFCRTTVVPIENSILGFIKNNESKDHYKIYSPVSSNVDWKRYLSISNQTSGLLNAIHTDLNKFMNTQRKEKMYLINKIDNEVAVSLEGAEIDRIDITKEVNSVLKRSPNNSIIFTHVHPSSTAFSSNDLYLMIQYKSISAYTLESANGDKYILERGNFKSSVLKSYTFFNNYDSIYKKVAEEFPELNDPIRIYGVWDDFIYKVNIKFAEFYGMDFRKVE